MEVISDPYLQLLKSMQNTCWRNCNINWYTTNFSWPPVRSQDIFFPLSTSTSSTGVWTLKILTRIFRPMNSTGSIEWHAFLLNHSRNKYKGPLRSLQRDPTSWALRTSKHTTNNRTKVMQNYPADKRESLRLHCVNCLQCSESWWWKSELKRQATNV